MSPTPTTPARPRPSAPSRRLVLAAGLVGTLTLALTAGGCGGGDAPAAPGPARPLASERPKVPTNLLLVDLSGVRYEDVAPAGATATPALPAFGALETAGTFFTQAVSPAPWDLAAVVGLLTGNLPSECAIRGRPDNGQSLIPAVETLAEMLSKGGYATAGFTAGGRIAAPARINDGFGVWREVEDDAARLAAAKAWIEALPPEQPRFLFLHATVGAGAGPSRAQRLADLDAWLDAAQALRRVPAKQATFFVALSDHGDVLSEREGVPQTGEADVLDAQIRVPLVAIGPGFPPGRQAASVGLVDLVATVRDRLGLEPWRPALEGRSWAPLLDGKPAAGWPVRSQTWRRLSTKDGKTEMRVQSVRLPRVKWVSAYDEYLGAWDARLFDLAADPTEASPLEAQDVERFGGEFVALVDRIRAELKGGQEQHADPIAGPYFARPR